MQSESSYIDSSQLWVSKMIERFLKAMTLSCKVRTKLLHCSRIGAHVSYVLKAAIRYGFSLISLPDVVVRW